VFRFSPNSFRPTQLVPRLFQRFRTGAGPHCAR
jgi:hypothetical protein